MPGVNKNEQIAILYPYDAGAKIKPGKIPNSEKVLVNNDREILIAPLSLVLLLDDQQVAGYGTMRDVISTLGMIGPSRRPTHEVLLQEQPSFPPHIIIKAIQKMLKNPIGEIERYYYPDCSDFTYLQIRFPGEAVDVDAYLRKINAQI